MQIEDIGNTKDDLFPVTITSHSATDGARRKINNPDTLEEKIEKKKNDVICWRRFLRLIAYRGGCRSLWGRGAEQSLALPSCSLKCLFVSISCSSRSGFPIEEIQVKTQLAE